MNKRFKTIRSLALTAGLVWAAISAAQTPLPFQNTLPYQTTGRIDSINVGSGHIVIGDVGFQFAPNVVVRSADGRAVTPGSLSKGMKTGINFRSDGQRMVITDIWILSGR